MSAGTSRRGQEAERIKDAESVLTVVLDDLERKCYRSRRGCEQHRGQW